MILYLEMTVCENKDEFGGKVTYQEGTVKDRRTLLSLITRSLLIKSEASVVIGKEINEYQ